MKHIISLASLLVGLTLSGTARTEDRILPTPRVTIYPGDVIADSMLEDRAFAAEAAHTPNWIETRAGLVGRVARRTLLPHLPVQAISVDNPHLVSLGARVKIIFLENGLIITAYGTALQAGGVGDSIRVRNQDSGLTVTGRIQADGSIRVSEG